MNDSERIAILETHIAYIRQKVDDIDKRLNKLMWRVISIGATSGTIATATALMIAKYLP